MKAIEINGLTKMYKDKAAVKNVHLEVNEGEIFGFIGPNGAGKSTTIKALLNFIYPTSGSAKILGLDSVKDSKAIKREVSYVSSDVRFYPAMTASEIIGYAAEFHQIQDAEAKIKHYYDRFEIESNKKLGDMSLGNKKKVAIVAGLIAEPKLMILDEPSSGLDPLMQHRLFEILTEKNKSGMTVFLSSHDLMEVQNYCSKAAFIKDGELIRIEDIDKDKADGKVVQLRGKNLIGTEFIKKGATIIESTTSSLKFIYNGDLQLILPLFVNSSITDIIIKNQDLEDKFMAMYEGGKKA